MVNATFDPNDSRNGTAACASLPEKRAGAPFSVYSPAKVDLPVVIAVPHAGRDYTAEMHGRLRQPEFVKKRLEDRYVDAVALEVLQSLGVVLFIAHAPRAILDLNRSPEDIDWTMISEKRGAAPQNSIANRRARNGLGLIPRRLAGLGEIWRGPLTQDELTARIDTIHRPYHQALSQQLAQIRDEWGSALLIDLHSMPPLPVKPGESRGAEFVIGDRFGASCDPGLVSKGQRFLESKGRIVTYNRPYSGGYVLDAHGLPRHGIHALQLELCRSIYLDDDLDKPNDSLQEVAGLVAEFARLLGSYTAERGGTGFSALAAE